MKKFDSGILKVALLAWGVPLIVVTVAWWATPDPDRAIETFATATFVPKEIKVIRKQERKNSDFFELWLIHTDGSVYFRREPDPERLRALADALPKTEPLRVVYETDSEGNVILEIARADGSQKPYLAFEGVMAEYAARRRLVAIIAGIWFILGTGCLVPLWRTRIAIGSNQLSTIPAAGLRR
jgi:hypothetical protein